MACLLCSYMAYLLDWVTSQVESPLGAPHVVYTAHGDMSQQHLA